MTNVKISLPGGGICSILTIIFVVFRILGYITWSWWLVFAPLWIPLLLVLGIPAIAFVIAFIVICIREWLDGRARAKNRKRWH